MLTNAAFLSEFFDNAPLVFTCFDEKLCITNANKAGLAIIKAASKEAVIGKHIEEISPGIRETGRLEIYDNVLKTGKPVHLRSIVTVPALGSKHMGAFVFRIESGIAIIALDVSEWVEEEKKIIRQLEQKNKELEQYAYVASHDLQEPLETISSFVGLMNIKYQDQLDDRGKKYLGFIVQATLRMKRLVTELLEYSRVGKKENFATINLNELLQSVVTDLKDLIEKNNARIEYSKLPALSANETELKQLFQNLISNAIKFRKKDTSPLIVISSEKKESCWQFELKDNGIGIDKKFHERIFTIFQRLHNRSEYEGTGIGLALCKKIVEIHGGNIWVESEAGNGSTFYFTIKS